MKIVSSSHNAKRNLSVTSNQLFLRLVFACQQQMNLRDQRKNQLPLPLLHPVRYYGVKIPKKEARGKKKGKVKVELTVEEMEKVISVNALHERMKATVEKLKTDYVQHLSVRTSAGAFDKLPVEFEGGIYPLNELAQIARKSPQLLVINVSAMPKAVQPILKSLQDSGMNLNPQQEGNTIYVTIPMITKEHREHLAKSAKSLFLKSKEGIRSIQESFVRVARKQKEDFSEDLIYNIQQQIIVIADTYIAEAEGLMEVKQQELLGSKK